MSFIDELKRRNVFRVGVAYVIVAWLLLQVADVILDNIEAPAWVFQAILLLLIIGFPVTIIFAWAFELTPEGFKKEKDIERSESVTPVTGRKLDFVIIGLLTAALGYLAYDKFLASPPASQDSIQSIAVLPFVDMSPDGDQEYFGDGIAVELLNELTRLDGLRVAGRTSSFSFKGTNENLKGIAEALDVATILEGSIRKDGDRVRIKAQLINIADGENLWSETYDRKLTDIFVIQE